MEKRGQFNNFFKPKESTEWIARPFVFPLIISIFPWIKHVMRSLSPETANPPLRIIQTGNPDLYRRSAVFFDDAESHDDSDRCHGFRKYVCKCPYCFDEESPDQFERKTTIASFQLKGERSSVSTALVQHYENGKEFVALQLKLSRLLSFWRCCAKVLILTWATEFSETSVFELDEEFWHDSDATSQLFSREQTVAIREACPISSLYIGTCDVCRRVNVPVYLLVLLLKFQHPTSRAVGDVW